MDTSKNTPPPDLHKLTHDIRNIMGAISNYAQVLELSLDESRYNQMSSLRRNNAY